MPCKPTLHAVEISDAVIPPKPYMGSSERFTRSADLSHPKYVEAECEIGERTGDKAPMAYVELVDRPIRDEDDLGDDTEVTEEV